MENKYINNNDYYNTIDDYPYINGKPLKKMFNILYNDGNLLYMYDYIEREVLYDYPLDKFHNFLYDNLKIIKKIPLNDKYLFITNRKKEDFKWYEGPYYNIFNKIYYNGVEILGSDPNTFKVLDYYHAKDKNFVYSPLGIKLELFDVSTFEVIDKDYIKDKNFVYFQLNEIKGVDSGTFIVFDNGYSKDKNFVYYKGEKIEGAHSGSFEFLGEYYGKDKENAYLEGCIIKGAHPGSFKKLSYLCSKDKNFVYYGGEKNEGLDANTFEKIDNYYWKDKNFVYYLYKDINPNFKYSCNENISYFCERYRIEGAHSGSFETLNRKYTKDKNFVYYSGEKIEGAHPGSFKIIDYDDYDYGEDKYNVYFKGSIVEGAHPGSVDIFDNNFAINDDFVYIKTKKIEGISTSNFQSLYNEFNELGFSIEDIDGNIFTLKRMRN